LIDAARDGEFAIEMDEADWLDAMSWQFVRLRLRPEPGDNLRVEPKKRRVTVIHQYHSLNHHFTAEEHLTSALAGFVLLVLPVLTARGPDCLVTSGRARLRRHVEVSILNRDRTPAHGRSIDHSFLRENDRANQGLILTDLPS
jgi:hypothetical protein